MPAKDCKKSRVNKEEKDYGNVESVARLSQI